MKSIEYSDGAVHHPIAKPCVVISAAIAAIVTIPLLPFLRVIDAMRRKPYNADVPQTRKQAALAVQAACADDFSYVSLEKSLMFGKGFPDE